MADLTRKRKVRWISLLFFSTLFLLAVSVVSLLTGSAGIPISKIVSILLKERGGTEYSILIDIRLPRIILGFAVGGALSLAGVILQSMFRNPLVEPYTLGISGGAALGASLCIILGLSGSFPNGALPLSGFFGASVVIILLYIFNAQKKLLHTEGLLLAGVMISFISSSLVTLILAISSTEEIHNIIFWIMGSLEQPSWLLILTVFCVSLICLGLSYYFSLQMNALSLGEEEAIHLGVDMEKTKKLLFLIAALLTGISVSVSGLIGFVGLIVPHFVRILTGYDHRRLLVISFITGAGFLIACDTIARTVISPLQLPVGVITGILGGGIFIYILSRKLTAQGGGRI
jgi:iron complex transport system permease protein